MFRNYVVANYKATGRPTLLRIETPDGKGMNPEMSNVNIVPNPEVNEQLSSYVRLEIDLCSYIVYTILTNVHLIFIIWV